MDRAGSVWIFRFRFGFQSQVLDFGIRTPPQCKSILVCENTKMESINFHKSFNKSTLTEMVQRRCW